MRTEATGGSTRATASGDENFKQNTATTECGTSSAPAIGRVITGKLEEYILLNVIQECLYGSVMGGVGLTTGDAVAVKSLRCEDIEHRNEDRDLPETPLAEVFFAPILHGCKSVAPIREVIGSIDFHFVISDFANGEDLLELLKLYPLGLTEKVTAMVVRACAEGLQACHAKGVALQDFSLENCLLSYDIEGNYIIQLCDPGQAVLFQCDEKGKELPVEYSGSIGKKFRPPEIFLEKPYIATKVDSWCLGWSCFYFLFAVELFSCAREDDSQWLAFVDRKYDLLLSEIGVDECLVSHQAKDFIFNLLDPDPGLRMSVSEALQHPFLASVDTSDLNKSIFPPALASQTTSKLPDRLLLEILSLSPPGDRPRLLRTFSLQLPTLRSALHADLMKPLKEVESKARTLRRLVAEIGPIVPRRYFTYYLVLFCRKGKPSHCLLDHYDALLNWPSATARPGGSEAAFSTLFRESLVNSSSSRKSPRCHLASPLTREPARRKPSSLASDRPTRKLPSERSNHEDFAGVNSPLNPFRHDPAVLQCQTVTCSQTPIWNKAQQPARVRQSKTDCTSKHLINSRSTDLLPIDDSRIPKVHQNSTVPSSYFKFSVCPVKTHSVKTTSHFDFPNCGTRSDLTQKAVTGVDSNRNIPVLPRWSGKMSAAPERVPSIVLSGLTDIQSHNRIDTPWLFARKKYERKITAFSVGSTWRPHQVKWIGKGGLKVGMVRFDTNFNHRPLSVNSVMSDSGCAKTPIRANVHGIK